jgi:hypothetical protein
MGGFEGSIHFKLENMDPSLHVVCPLTFFLVNDGNKPNAILRQIMHCVICHSICQSYNVYSTTKKNKGMIFYNQQHGIIFIKKISWVNIQSHGIGGKVLMWLLIQRSCTETNPKKYFSLVMGPSSQIIRNGSPYEKDDAQ